MDKPKKLILDYSKWRCGGEGQYKLGEGEQALLNKEGFMCTLGQFHHQSGATNKQLIGNVPPHEALDPFLNDGFSYVAISINDDETTTPEEKINLLHCCLAAEGIELEVINKPNK